MPATENQPIATKNSDREQPTNSDGGFRFKRTEFPVPSRDDQLLIVKKAEGMLDAVERLRAQLDAAKSRGINLRRSLLSAAFSGRLTSAAPSLSQAEEMIDA